MSHCTTFNFQYTNRKCILRAFDNMGIEWTDVIIGTSGSIKWRTDEYSLAFGTKCPGIAGKRNGFNYLFEERDDHYELSMEKHNMTYSEQDIANEMADEFKQEYVRASAEIFMEKMKKKGIDCLMEEKRGGYDIRFGQTYEKSIFIKLNGDVIEEKVTGVKGKSCSSLTGALEDMMSPPDGELNTRWTEEYRQTEDNELTVYNLGSV